MTRLITALLVLQAMARLGRVAAAASESTHAADQQQQQQQPAPSAVPSGLSGPDYTGPSAGSDECDPEMVGFELVTGYVFTAPTNMLESIPGTLMLTDCLETCQANDSCQAVNYETGLCVLFSSNADSNPGKIESLSRTLSLALARAQFDGKARYPSNIVVDTFNRRKERSTLGSVESVQQQPATKKAETKNRSFSRFVDVERCHASADPTYMYVPPGRIREFHEACKRTAE